MYLPSGGAVSGWHPLNQRIKQCLQEWDTMTSSVSWCDTLKNTQNYPCRILVAGGVTPTFNNQQKFRHWKWGIYTQELVSTFQKKSTWLRCAHLDWVLSGDPCLFLANLRWGTVSVGDGAVLPAINAGLFASRALPWAGAWMAALSLGLGLAFSLASHVVREGGRWEARSTAVGCPFSPLQAPE